MWPVFVQILLIAPSDSAGSLARAAALNQAGEYDSALALLAPLVDAEPENARAWLAYGVAFHGKGEFDRAIEAFDRAARFDETKLAATYQRARSLARKGESDLALDALEVLKATAKYNVSDVGVDPELSSLKESPRFAKLYPTQAELRDPFIEEARIIHEWSGESEGDWFGWIARRLQDVDGDGVQDVVTSAPNKDVSGPAAGRIYVFSGKSGRLIWTASGSPGASLGLGVEAASDVDQDGSSDVVAGAPGAGKTFVYSGRDGSVILEISEKEPGEFFGRKVSAASDVDGDGRADVLVGAPGNDERGEDAGRAAIYSGKDGTILLEWFGEKAGDRFGSVVAGRGGTFVVGAPGAGEGNRGRVYVYRGSRGELAFAIDSSEEDVSLGAMFVSLVGDVDGDGVSDVYASDWSSNANGAGSGRIYVHSGATGRRLLAFAGEFPGDGFGIGSADASDVNGDGHDDLVVGAWQFSGAAPSGGKVYLFSGKDGSLLRTWTGKVPGDTLGFDATGVGDVDGDSIKDLLVSSAWSARAGSRSGRVYVLSSR